MKTNTNSVSASAVTADAFLTVELSAVEGLAVQRALSADKVKAVFEAGVADGTKAHVDVVVRVTCDLSKGEAGTRKATSRALRKATIALLIQRMGCTREAALELLAGVLTDVQTMSDEAEAALLEAHPEVEGAFGRLDALVDGLPRIPTQGTVKVTNVTIGKVL